MNFLPAAVRVTWAPETGLPEGAVSTDPETSHLILLTSVLGTAEMALARGVIIPTSRGSNLCGDSPTVPLLRETAESEWREDTELLVSSVMAGRKGVLSVASPGELVVEAAEILETPFTMMG